MVFLLLAGRRYETERFGQIFSQCPVRARCRWQLWTRCGRRRSALEIAIDPFQGFFTVP
jgi:hypothetical protein